jgi:hypothetical protein
VNGVTTSVLLAIKLNFQTQYLFNYRYPGNKSKPENVDLSNLGSNPLFV